MDDTAARMARAEALMARQEKILMELERDGHAKAAERARDVLETMRQTLRAMRTSSGFKTNEE